jgi:N6-adenosine-specific RNA methylase IME4
MVAARLANLSAGRPGKNTPVEAVSQDAAAEKLNVSRSAVQRAKAVVSQGTPELQAAVDAGQVAVSTAADIATLPKDEQKTVDLSNKKAVLAAAKQIRQENADKKREKKLEVAERIRKEPEPLPTGPFRVIAIDPPWEYDNRAEDESHRGRVQYPDMAVDDICKLPVPDLAHKDCVLWLWTTNAFMSEAYDCLFEWGFTAKTILTWDKQILGLGDYLRNVTEHCILAVRGKPTLTLTNQTTLISEKRREHSRKPEAFYALVESLCPGSKLEMFARERREGWQAWGAEVGKFN